MPVLLPTVEAQDAWLGDKMDFKCAVGHGDLHALYTAQVPDVAIANGRCTLMTEACCALAGS
jgi:hypothetical protein